MAADIWQMRAMVSLGAIFLTGALTGAAWGQSPPVDLRGIYIFTNDVSQINASIASQLSDSFSVTGVDGVALDIGWDAIEPSLGQYQWATLDNWIGQAIAAGRKIDLVVPAGIATPAWLFQAAPTGAGASALSFTVTPHNGATTVCDSVTLAAPWDPAFLSQWNAMLAALSAHLVSVGTYDAITLVRLTGINRTTEELRLPAETAQSTGLACVSNAIATWQQAGYGPTKLEQAWNTIVGDFQKNFPGKSFAVSLIPTAMAFPPIADNGTIITGALPNLTQSLMGQAAQILPGKLVVQFDFLMPGEQASVEVTQAAQNFGTMAAFQTNEYENQLGAGCSEPVTNPTPCTSATFLQMLEVGIYPLGQSNPLRAQYIEVFHANVSAFPDAILQGHNLLVPGPLTAGAPLIFDGGTVPIYNTATTIQPGSWASIYGTNLATGTTLWNSDFPTKLGGTTVTINGRPAYLWYVSPGQINFQAPDDSATGTVPVVVSIPTGSAGSTVTLEPFGPSWLVQADGKHVTAIVLTPGLPGNSGSGWDVIGPARPVKAGETLVVYGVGFGPTLSAVLAGRVFSGSTATANAVSVTIGGVAVPQANVKFSGVVEAGLYQLNIVMPSNLGSGDKAIVATVGGAQSQTNILLSVQ